MPNIVEIIITGKNLASPAIAAAEGEAKGLAGTVGKIGVAAAAAAAIVGVEAVKMGSKFQNEMLRLNTQAGVSKGKLKELSEGVLNLAGDVGFSPDSLSESLFHVESNFESMGISSKKALGLVKIAAEGAKVGGADLVDVTNALTAAVAANIPGVQNMDQAMGVLNATVGAGDMKMQDLAEAFGTGMVAVVKGFGLSIKDVGAALATFGDNNIRGAQAGTNLRMAVQALAHPSVGKAAKKALDELGLSSKDLAKDMQHGGLNEAITDLRNRLIKAGFSAKEQGSIITDAFGRKSGTGINILVGQYDRLESKYPALTKGANKFGEAWQAQSKTTAQRVADLRASFDSLMVRIGTALLPVANLLVGVLGKMVDFISKNHEVMVPLIAAITILGTAVLGLVVGIKLAQLAQALWNLTMVENPIGVLIAGIALLVIGIIYLATKTQFFQTIWKDSWGAIKKITVDVFNWIKHNWPLLVSILGGPIAAVAVQIIRHWSDIKNGIASAYNWLKKNVFLPLGAFFTSTIPNAAKRMYSGVNGAWNNVKNAAKTASSYVTSKWDSVVTFFKRLPGRMTSATKGIFSGLKNDFRAALNYVIDGWNRLKFTIGAFKVGPIHYGGITVNTPNIPRLAHGGIASGGMTLVGENGPEVVNLPGGSHVRTNADYRAMPRHGGGGNMMNLTIDSRGSDLDKVLCTVLKSAIRRYYGGNVEQALGKG